MKTETEEIWKSVDGYEGMYEVSTFGSVRSLSRPCPGRKWPIRGQIMKHVFRGGRKGAKYSYVSLANPPLKLSKAVHRLVAIAFIPNPNNKPEVNHKDGNKQNNHYNNLEWSTRKENVNHSLKDGLVLRDGVHFNATMTLEKVIRIKKELLKGAKQCVIAKKHNVHCRIIQAISCGRTWKHVTI